MRGELTVVRCVGAVALLCGALIAHAQADLVLHNGKVVTVDGPALTYGKRARGYDNPGFIASA